MHDFTAWRSGLGGVLIGLSASLLWLGAGRVAGISSLVFVTSMLLGMARWRAWTLRARGGVRRRS